MNKIAKKFLSPAQLHQNFAQFCSGKDNIMSNFERILQNNKEWAAKSIEKEPTFFSKLVGIQTPKYLWLGCADSRVPANEIIGLQPGEVFVHRNIANIMPPSDTNVLAVVQYAVQYLKVEDIIVAGHYGCGGVKAAFDQNDYGALEAWLSHLRQLRTKYRNNLIGSMDNRINTLVELNVAQQVINVGRMPFVQNAWKEGRKLVIHGVVYDLKDGILKDLGLTLSAVDHLPDEFQIIK